MPQLTNHNGQKQIIVHRLWFYYLHTGEKILKPTHYNVKTPCTNSNIVTSNKIYKEPSKPRIQRRYSVPNCGIDGKLPPLRLL